MIIAQTAETMNEVMKGIDRASAAGDRWLFIAALVILLIFVGLVIKWLVDHINTKDKRIEDKEAMHDGKLKEREALSKIERDETRASFLSAIDLLKSEMAGQTAQLKSLTDILTTHDRDMRDAHRIETAALVRAEFTRLGINPDTLKQPIG